MERNITFDIMKGIGIILMLVGHLPGIGMMHQFIYSFHMPMFIFLSGYLAKPANRGGATVFALF